MNVLHIAMSFAYVHKALIEYEMKAGAECRVFQYNLRRKKDKSLPAYVESYNSPFHSRGLFFFQERLRTIIDNAAKLYGGGEYEIIHAHYLHADGQVAYKIAQKNHIPYVVTVRNSDLYTPALWKLPRNRRKLLMTLENASAVIFLGPSHKRELLSRLSEEMRSKIQGKSVIIPNGIDEFWHQNQWKNRSFTDGGKILITVGDIESNKNQIAVMRVLKLLRDSGSDYRYVVIGRPVNKRIVSKLKKNGVEVLPYQEKDRLLDYYRKSRIFILPSFKETFGLVYPEAMSQGLPVIYTKGQGFDGQFDNGVVGFAVRADRPQEIAAAVQKIESDYSRISENARHGSEKFRWSHVAEELIDVYKEAINERISAKK